MSHAELAARMLVQAHLRRRKMPRALHDAVIAMVSARLQSGAQSCLTEVMQTDIDLQAVPGDAHAQPAHT